MNGGDREREREREGSRWKERTRDEINERNRGGGEVVIKKVKPLSSDRMGK